MSGVRHVWVRPEWVPTEMPGLILGWQKQADGTWSALVTYIEPQGRVITEWATADRMRPVRTQPYTGSQYG